MKKITEVVKYPREEWEEGDRIRGTFSDGTFVEGIVDGDYDISLGNRDYCYSEYDFTTTELIKRAPQYPDSRIIRLLRSQDIDGVVDLLDFLRSKNIVITDSEYDTLILSALRCLL